MSKFLRWMPYLSAHAFKEHLASHAAIVRTMPEPDRVALAAADVGYYGMSEQ
jgi:hypothetical protein